MTDPYENLANAIVLQAVKDYRDSLKRLKKKPGNQAAMSDAMECERFFRSGWYTALTLEKMWTLEKKIAGALEMLSDLKKQIREVIEAVPDTDERMVLKYRYIHNYTWEQIGMELCADARTIRRWHGKALLHVTLPDDPIII